MIQTKKSLLLLVLAALVSGTANKTFAQGLSVERIAVKDAPQTELRKKLTNLKNVTEVIPIQNNVPLYSEKYAVKIEQEVVPGDATKGKFDQQIYVAHVGFDAPTVVVTDGYTGGFGMNPRYSEELSRRYKANVAVIQHRYFEQSTPKPTDWQYMRGKYAAHDTHKIVEALKSIYKGKFIASGVSKGGQNTMIYATYYPNDVDFYVPYVGPVCYSLEDKRHEDFLANIGPESDRKKIYDFQTEVLKRRNTMVPMLKEYAQKNNLTFGDTSIDEVLDMVVLEYSFGLWQMACERVKDVPATTVSDEELFKHLVTLCDPSYFANNSSTSPFYIQAALELGYYTYDLKPFKGLLSIKDDKGYLKRIMMKGQHDDIKFNPELYKDINKFLKKSDLKMMFIYGEYDPWTAVAPEIKFFKNKKNMKFYLCPKYDHKTRINSFPEATRDEIWGVLDMWMNE